MFKEPIEKCKPIKKHAKKQKATLALRENGNKLLMIDLVRTFYTSLVNLHRFLLSFCRQLHDISPLARCLNCNRI